MKQFSRRSALFSTVIIPAIAVSRPDQTSGVDFSLLTLGHKFDALTEKLDGDLNISWETLEEFGEVETQIIATPATTIEGLCVKARVTCWALLGDLDPNEQSTANERMALSIVRDLIRLYDPNLERPGELERLVCEIERTAEARRQHQGLF